MKLASITLPLPEERWKPNPGRSLWCNKQRRLDAGHKAIAVALLEWCQGYSAINVSDVWADGDKIYREAGMRYEFTSPDTQTSQEELRALAYRIKTISDEEAIFIVHANGNTEIVR